MTFSTCHINFEYKRNYHFRCASHFSFDATLPLRRCNWAWQSEQHILFVVPAASLLLSPPSPIRHVVTSPGYALFTIHLSWLWVSQIGCAVRNWRIVGGIGWSHLLGWASNAFCISMGFWRKQEKLMPCHFVIGVRVSNPNPNWIQIYLYLRCLTASVQWSLELPLK